MLEILNLTKMYGKYKAANDVNLAVEDGEIGILLGPNGAGKSTVIKSIAGLLRYDGKILIQGMDAKSMEAKKIFAYVPELPAMYDALTVREHIEFIINAYHVPASEEDVKKLFERFELTDKQDKLGNELSKGMMQKVSICCALIIRPKVILLDEPTFGLDSHNTFNLIKLFQQRVKNCQSIIMVTHDSEIISRYPSRRLYVENKRILEIEGDKHV